MSDNVNPTAEKEMKELKHFHPRTYNFGDIVENDDFVDKTLLIKTIFVNNPSKIVITAPSGWGKSMNMDMVKKFVEVQADHVGVVIDKEASSNYQFFKKNNLLIYQEQKFFNDNFATYPVIYADFKPATGTTFAEILKGFGTVLNKSFWQHEYLLKTKDMCFANPRKYYIFLKYMDMEECQTLVLEEIKVGLAFLAQCLYEHFGGKKVFVLIDEYDAPFNTLFQNDIDINEVNELLCGIFSNILQGNQYVERALLTGLMNFATVSLSGVSNIGQYTFPNDHPFVPYYGLTEDEVTKLLTKFKIDDDTQKKLESHYGGYCINGVKLYRLAPVLKFLREKNKNN